MVVAGVVDLGVTVIFYFTFFKLLYYLNVWRLTLVNDSLETAKQNAAYFNSFINAVGTTFYSLVVIYELFHKIWDIDASSPNMPYYFAFTLGYFMQDSTHLLSIYSKNKKTCSVFLFHHITFGAVIVWTMMKNKYHGIGAIVGLTEISTAILDVFHYTKYYANFYSSLGDKDLTEKFNQISYKVFRCFAWAFFVVRIVGVLLVIIFYYNKFIEQEPVMNWIFGIMMTLNTSWMYMIYNMKKNFKFVKMIEKKVD